MTGVDTSPPVDRAPEELDELVRRAQARDEAALAAVVAHCQLELRLFIASRVKRIEQIDDLEQETWMAVLGRLETYRGGGTFLSWIKGFARNHLLRANAHRQREALRSVRDELGDLVATPPVETEAAVAATQLRRLDECLGQLTPRVRGVVEAHHRDGLALELLASRFATPPHALASLLWRARAALRRCLERSLAK